MVDVGVAEFVSVRKTYQRSELTLFAMATVRTASVDSRRPKSEVFEKSLSWVAISWKELVSGVKPGAPEGGM